MNPRTLAALIVVTSTALLSGCSSHAQQSTATDATVTSASVLPSGESAASEAPAVAEVPQSTQDQEESCSGITGQEALVQSVGQVPPVERNTWDPSHAGTDSYDQCLPLSYIVLPVKNSLASSPYHIMLFHSGRYLGTATAEPYGYAPAISRVSPSEISVTYRTAFDSGTTPGSRGTTTAQFTWDPQANKVVMSGQVPDGVSAPPIASAQGASSASSSGDCGSTNGYAVTAETSTSCAFAIATVNTMDQRGRPEMGHHSSPFQVSSPVTGLTYTMRCSMGSSGAMSGECRDANGGTAVVRWQLKK